MKPSFALVAGVASGPGYAAAKLLAAHGYGRVIIIGSSLARVQETTAQLACHVSTMGRTLSSMSWTNEGRRAG
jgi:NAD(P)-dependent dehydrogenase (short-subunit alcohol dehydrogenase family)